MRARALLALLAVTAPTAVAAQVVDLPDMRPEALPGLGGGSRTFVAAEREFALEVPPGWNVARSEKDPGTYELRPADGTDASVFVRRMKVPRGASPRQLLLNALEQRLRKLPSFREGKRRDVKVAGQPGAVVDGGYYFQGNAQYPRTIEELFVVRGDEAFVFHFEAFEPVAASVSPALELVYRSFVIRPPAGVRPGVPSPATPELGIDTDRIPF